MVVAGGLLLQQRSLAALGALLLGKVMTGAIASHLFLIGGSMTAPLLLLILLAVFAAGRWARQSPGNDSR
jgi:putative oxidoreductase